MANKAGKRQLMNLRKRINNENNTCDLQLSLLIDIAFCSLLQVVIFAENYCKICFFKKIIHNVAPYLDDSII